MPIRQGGRLASRASTWPRDHFCRSTMAPRASWPTTWNEFLPISMPGDRGIGCLRHGVLLVFGAPCQLRLLAGQEHGRTIPLADFALLRSDCFVVLVVVAHHSCTSRSVRQADRCRCNAESGGRRGPPRRV